MHKITLHNLRITSNIQNLVKSYKALRFQKLANSNAVFSQYSTESAFPTKVDFPARHIGPREHDIKEMLNFLGFKVCVINFTKIVILSISYIHKLLKEIKIASYIKIYNRQF